MEIKFKPEEIKERRNKDGSISQFPIVGGRLRIAHETNDKLSISTELVSHHATKDACMKAQVVTAKGAFTAYGAASASKDARLIDSLLELAETRAVARALRFAGYGVELTGIEEIGEDAPAIADSFARDTAPPQPQTPKSEPITRAQLHAIQTIATLNRWSALDCCRKIIRVPDLARIEDLTKAEAGVIIGRMKDEAAKAAHGQKRAAA